MTATKTVKFLLFFLLLFFEICALIFLLALSTFNKCSLLYQIDLVAQNQKLEGAKVLFLFWCKELQISGLLL